MTRIVYVGPFDSVEIEHPVGAALTARRGEPVDLPERLAQALLDQPDNWQPAPPEKAKK